ncbi:MAG: C25 family cysteine peptidase [Candidatus Omnitrophica bacterium]|nr:C25 family cysteine peptidase [Candidatus Omnitrophota bacterium]
MIKKISILLFAVFAVFCLWVKTLFAYEIDPTFTDASCIILTTTQYTAQAEQLATFEESMTNPIGTPMQTAIYFLNDPTVSNWLNLYGKPNEPPLANPDVLNPFNPSGAGDWWTNTVKPPWLEHHLARQILSFILDLSNALDYQPAFVSAPLMQDIILFGNSASIPPADYVLVPTNQNIINCTTQTGSNHHNWYPTDLIYACAGQSGLISIAPQYAISRIPVNNTNEANTIITKIQNWYNNANSANSWNWFKNVAFAGGGQNTIYNYSSQIRGISSQSEPPIPTPRIYWGEMDALNIINAVDSTTEGGYNNKSYLSGMNVSKYFLTNPQNSPQYFTSTNVNTLLSTGNNGFVYLIGSGNYNDLSGLSGNGDPDDFYFDDGSNINTTDFQSYPSDNYNLPVIISSGDDNTAFDTLYYTSGNSLGKSSLLSSGGAIAFIGPDRQIPFTLPNFYFINGILHLDQKNFPQFMEEFAKYYHRATSNPNNSSAQTNLGTIYASALDDFYNINSPTWSVDDYITIVECEFFGDPALYIPSQQISSTVISPPQIQALNPGNPTSSSALQYDSLNIPVYAIPGGSNVNINPFKVSSTITDTAVVSSLTTDFIDTRYSLNDSNPGENTNFPLSGGTGTYTVNFGSTDTGPGSNGPGLYFVRVANNSASNLPKETRMYIDVDNQFTYPFSSDVLLVLNDQFRWADRYPLIDFYTESQNPNASNSPDNTNYNLYPITNSSAFPVYYQPSSTPFEPYTPYLVYLYENPNTDNTYTCYDSRIWYISAIYQALGNLGYNNTNTTIWNVINLYDGNNIQYNGQSQSGGGQTYLKTPGINKYGGITWEALKSYLGKGSDGNQKMVIWVTGKNNNDTFSPSDQIAVDSFLSEGGKLLVIGQNIGHDIGSSQFYTNTLMANKIQDDIALYDIAGISTNPLSKTLNNIQTINPDGALDPSSQLSNFPEEIDPQGGASLCFLYETGSASGPGAPQSSDGAGLTYYNPITNGTLVYLPFDFARINNFSGTSNGRVAVLSAIFNWLLSPTQTGVFTATPGNSQITLNWQTLPPNQTGILILRKVGGYPTSQPTNGTTYTVGQSIGDGTIVYVDGATPLSYIDTGLTNGKAYYYTAYTYTSNSAYSLYGNAYATPSSGPPPSGLVAPSNLTASSQIVGSTWQVNLNWQYTGTSETGFQIQRYILSGNTYTDTTTFQVGQVLNWTDTTVSANTTYVYMIRAFKNGSPIQYSQWSNTAITTTAILQAPVGLNAIPGQNEVTLQWTNASNPLAAKGIYIQRNHPTPSNPNPSFTTIAAIPSTDNSFVDSGIDVSTGNYLGSGYFCDGRPYYYQVIAFNQTNSETSNVAEATPSAFPSGQNPTNLTFLPGVNGFTVTWNDNTTTETAYYIEAWNSVPSDIANPDTIIVVPGTTTTGTMSQIVSVSSGGTWYARVIALNSSSTGHPGFSLYATSSNGQNYSSGNIFGNLPVSSSSGGGGTPVGPLVVLLSLILLLFKLLKRKKYDR